MNEGIVAENLVKSFGDPPQMILKDISMEIEVGEFVALIGKSGSGKSTLLYILSGLDEPTSGKVFLNGLDLTSIDSKTIHKLRNESLGFVFQFHYLLSELTAFENITMPARKQNQLKKAEEYAMHLLKEFSLLHCKNKLPSQMSGGEQQRVAIARALIQRPKFLFADEPTGNLDTANGDNVMEMFKKINKEEGTTILFVTHDLDYAKAAKKRVHMQDGEIYKID
ncbi:MAG: ABC transporter ATP-binding protein [Leptospira sp.]|nr:ABC transporter ATP-binding protein [Leptospira sp.]